MTPFDVRPRSFVLVLALAAGCSEARSASSSPASTAAPTAPAVRLEAAVAVQDPVTVELPVTLQAERSVVVSPLSAGRVEAGLVDRGAHVEAGDGLVRLRDVDPVRSKRVTDAMLTMVKLDISTLEQAYRG